MKKFLISILMVILITSCGVSNRIVTLGNVSVLSQTGEKMRSYNNVILEEIPIYVVNYPYGYYRIFYYYRKPYCYYKTYYYRQPRQKYRQHQYILLSPNNPNRNQPTRRR